MEEVINKIDRFSYGGVDMSEDIRPPKATKAIMDGLLWSDPLDEPGGKCFQQSARGCGWKWSPLATQIFCEHNDLDFVCRSHQCVLAGREWHHGRLVLTIFSAANYCGVQHNRGAVLHVTKDWDIAAAEYDAAAAPVPAMPALPKYFAPVMEPVQFPEYEGGYEELRAELGRLKQLAVEDTKFSEAARLKRQMSALMLTGRGGGWVYEDDAGMTPEDKYHFHFKMEGKTVIGHCTDQGNDCQNRIEVGVNGDTELTLKEEDNTYDCALAKEGDTISGTWHATDGTSGNFSLQHLPPAADDAL